ncbi:MAG TPA: hypothetical protein VHO50_12810 [Bacteroidales bacterium]|nr:hypothetical protein [Bacteroidales bacterium]
MKAIKYILISAIVLLLGCGKDPEESSISGTVTIDNNTYFKNSTYYINGYSFSMGKMISTLEDPGPDISVYADPFDPQMLYFDSNVPLSTFAKIGEFSSETEAKNAFNNLSDVPANATWAGLANPVLANQVWIFKSGRMEKYTKIRITHTFAEQRYNAPLQRYFDYAECTFEYVHQPDGSLTFPK